VRGRLKRERLSGVLGGAELCIAFGFGGVWYGRMYDEALEGRDGCEDGVEGMRIFLCCGVELPLDGKFLVEPDD